MQVLVLYNGRDDQNVLEQGDDAQDEKDLRRTARREANSEMMSFAAGL